MWGSPSRVPYPVCKFYVNFYIRVWSYATHVQVLKNKNLSNCLLQHPLFRLFILKLFFLKLLSLSSTTFCIEPTYSCCWSSSKSLNVLSNFIYFLAQSYHLSLIYSLFWWYSACKFSKRCYFCAILESLESYVSLLLLHMSTLNVLNSASILPTFCTITFYDLKERCGFIFTPSRNSCCPRFLDLSSN